MNFEKLVWEILEEKKKSRKKRKSKVPSNKVWGYWGPWYGVGYPGIGSYEGGEGSGDGGGEG
jgi:hypothetical protein